MQYLYLSLIGGFSLTYSGRRIAIRNRKAQVLLAYLALSQDFRQTREQLAGLLWSNVPESNARGSLRQALRSLKQVFAELSSPGLQISRNEASLDSSEFEVDVWSVLDNTECAKPHPLMLEKKCLSEELLLGFEDVDAAVKSWLMVQRQIFHERLVFSLESKLNAMEENVGSQQHQATKELALALSNLDPTHEGACRYLMLTYAKEGDISRALDRYKALYDLLDTEHDMEPSIKTQNLVVSIKIGDFDPPLIEPSHRAERIATTEAGALDSGKQNVTANRLMIVVGAFQSHTVGENTGQSAQGQLMKGFRHHLISNLVRFREWSVIDGSTENPLFKLPTPDRAQYTIEATSYQSNGKIELILTASDQGSKEYVWSAEYSENSEQWLASQRQVVRKIAFALNVHLSADRVSKVIGKPDISLPIFDRWLKGLDQARLWRPKNRIRTASFFRSIIGDAPSFAPAYCNLINFHNSVNQMFPGVFRTEENMREATSLVKVVVGLEPTNSKTQLCAAWSYAMNGQFDLAELGYKTAYDLNENDPWTLVSSTLGLALCGRHEIALTRANQAVELGLTVEPLHWGYQTIIRFLCSDYEGALKASTRSGDVAYSFLGWNVATLGQLGLILEAREKWDYFKNLIRQDWQGAKAFEDRAIAEWLLQTFPIRNRSDWKRLRDGLKVVGASIGTVGKIRVPRTTRLTPIA